jgi:hypothetical protein
MVIKGATGDGLVRTALPPAEPDEQCDAGPGGAGSLGSLTSNVSAAQEGILPGTSNVDPESVLRRDAAVRSSTGILARALPMPFYYSARTASPIPKPADSVGRIRHQATSTHSWKADRRRCAPNRPRPNSKQRVQTFTDHLRMHVFTNVRNSACRRLNSDMTRCRRSASNGSGQHYPIT